MQTMNMELLWFFHNVDLQVEDANLQSKEIDLVYYWDTQDVRRAVLGMPAFYDVQSTFNREEFHSRNALVTSLAAAGWLDRIQLLQPHQAEFLNLVSLEFELRGRSVPPGGLDQFLRDVGLQDQSVRTEGPMKELVQQEAGLAERLFKAVQAISGIWETRLANWYKSGLLCLPKDSEFSIDTALGSPLFDRLIAYFDRQRPDYRINNLTDAVALCGLQHQINRFKSGKSKTLPRFFASTSLLANAQKAVGSEDFLRYESGGQLYSVLRDPDYYLFKATLNPPRHLRRPGYDPPSLDQISSMANELRQLADKFGEVPQKILDSFVFDGRRIIELVQGLRRISFLEQVWLPYGANIELEQAKSDHIRVSRELATNPEFQLAVKETIREAVEVLTTNVEEYSWLAKLCLELEYGLRVCKKQHSKLGSAPTDAFLTYGLVRFGIPAALHREIRTVFAAALAGDESTETAALAKLIGACRIASRAKSTPELAVTLSVLWICDLDTRIEQLLRKREQQFGRELEDWVQVFRAAAIFRSHRGIARGEAILKALETKLRGDSGSIRRELLAIGIAYLYFHLWKCKGGDALWRRAHPTFALDNSSARHAVGWAIEYARTAYEKKHDDVKLHVYSLNQLLYYTAEGGTREQFEKSSPLLKELLTYRTDGRLWQYRYDDTLARSFHRLSTETDDVDRRLELIGYAKLHIKQAFDASVGDREVAQYMSILGLLPGLTQDSDSRS